MIGPSCFIGCFLTVLQITCLYCHSVDQSEYSLQIDDVVSLVLGPGEVATLYVPVIPDSYLYTMVQFHSQRWNLSLSSSRTFDMGATKLGTDVGLTVAIDNTHTDTATSTDTDASTDTDTDTSRRAFYLKSINATTNVTVVGIAQHLDNDDPLPGGCNQVFNLEIDASVEVTYSTGRTNLLFQWANVAKRTEPDCEASQIQKDLQYDIYALFLNPTSLSEGDFIDNVKDMFTASSIADKAVKVTTLTNAGTSKPQLFMRSESSRGVIYSVVARMANTSIRPAPYIAAVTYSCNLDINGDCSVDLNAGEIIFTIVATVCGGFLLLIGHRMFKISQFTFGYIFTCTVAFLLLTAFQATSDTSIYIISGCLGLVGGLVWLSVWYYCSFPIASVIVPGFCAGYLVAATLYFTPFADIDWWESNMNYALCFICFCFIYTVLLMAYAKFLSIMSCCIVGAYMFLMVIAMPLHSSLRLIVIYTFNRQTLKDYEKVKVVVPNLTTVDFILLIMWPILTIVGIVCQFVMQRGRPDFELPVKKQRNRQRVGRERPLLYVGDDDLQEEEERQDERARLIPDANQRGAGGANYNTVDDFPSSGTPSERTKNLFR